MGPCDLSSVLAKLGTAVDPRLLVGPENLDDAAALGVSDDLAVLFTADFITPLVDEARSWGRIAAANSISDIYAMGGRPLAALNLVCWPADLGMDLLGQVLQGGSEVARDAQCLVAGGHTIEDREPKYGMAVIGLVHPARIVRNRGALPGDWLYLTKPLGTGVLATAIKGELADEAEIVAAVASMAQLNRAAAEAAVAAAPRAMTDVTGFGLAGHLLEMLGPSGDLGAELSWAALPVLPGVARHMTLGLIPRGAYRNRTAYAPRVNLDPRLPAGEEMLLFDPQTSGGLLIAIPPEAAERWESQAQAASVPLHRIGKFTRSGRIDVRP